MEHLTVPQFLGLLVVILATARVLGLAASKIGQPAVLGELLAGLILGKSILGLVDPANETLHLLAEIGVVLLLFEIGLETDLRRLLAVGPTSGVVALVGVALPFALGYAVCRMLGLSSVVAVVAGASLTATSVGITARVLSDLGRLQSTESQIVLGAAVVDDVIGLIILAVVAGIAEGEKVTVGGVAIVTGVAFGFLAVILIGGRLVVPLFVRWANRSNLSASNLGLLGIMLAFGLAWLASVSGSAMIIGAFAAGLLLASTPLSQGVREGVGHVGNLFVPLFFVVVGAAVDVRVMNPFDASNHGIQLLAGLLILAAVAGKFLAGYAPWWFRGNRAVIGVGMIPRGEVGLIFAQMGRDSGVFDVALFSAVAVMVMVTTFVTPPLLKYLFSSARTD